MSFRFLKNEATTIVRVKPTSDTETQFVSFTICPEYHSAYKRDVLKNHNMTAHDYRFQRAVWYPANDMKIMDGKEFFHSVTFEMHEIIEKIKISTMSLDSPKIVIDDFQNFTQRYVEFYTQYEDTYGRCYTMNATESLLKLKLKYVEFVTRMSVYVFIEHPGQHLHGNSRSKVLPFFYSKCNGSRNIF